MHKFVSTEIEHHDDGSATVHHMHEDPTKCVRHAVADLDAIHDSLEDYLREHEEHEEEEEREEKLEEEVHPGIHEEIEKRGEE